MRPLYTRTGDSALVFFSLLLPGLVKGKEEKEERKREREADDRGIYGVLGSSLLETREINVVHGGRLLVALKNRKLYN